MLIFRVKAVYVGLRIDAINKFAPRHRALASPSFIMHYLLSALGKYANFEFSPRECDAVP